MAFPGVGGTEVATRRVAEAVRPFGVQSAALLLSPCEDQAAYFEQAGIPCLTDPSRPEHSLVREAPRFLAEFGALARRFADFDLIHCSDTQAAYYAALAGRLAGRPVLCHVRNREARIPRRNRLFIGAANHFAFVSQCTREDFPMRLPKRRTSILYDGVEVSRALAPGEQGALAAGLRAEFGLPPDAVIAAMFARVNPQKDYETLIRAAALLRGTHPQLRFLVVGDKDRVPLNREHYAQVTRLAAAAGVLDRFVFAGFREDTPRLMSAADVCVLCTHFEGLPLALIEAMAAGRPCVATAVDGVPEALTNGVTGLLHRHKDAGGLAAAIARLVDTPAYARRLGTAARAEAAASFGQERFAEDVYSLYRRLARPSPARAERRARQPLPALAEAPR
jgi:glycosyltransferase involved in cell wall biosynthesis